MMPAYRTAPVEGRMRGLGKAIAVLERAVEQACPGRSLELRLLDPGVPGSSGQYVAELVETFEAHCPEDEQAPAIVASGVAAEGSGENNDEPLLAVLDLVANLAKRADREARKADDAEAYMASQAVGAAQARTAVLDACAELGVEPAPDSDPF
jgi:hypothetical protein